MTVPQVLRKSNTRCMYILVINLSIRSAAGQFHG